MLSGLVSILKKQSTDNRVKTGLQRQLNLERLENRQVLSASVASGSEPRPPEPGVVFASSLDANHDGYVTPLDALLVINKIHRDQNQAGDGEAAGQPSPFPHPADVNCDGRVDKGDFDMIFAAISGSNPRVQAVNSWHNLTSPADVNGDGTVSALDALVILNETSRHTITDSSGQLLRDRAVDEFFYDVTNDAFLNSDDFQGVLNAIELPRVAALPVTSLDTNLELESTLTAISLDVAEALSVQQDIKSG